MGLRGPLRDPNSRRGKAEIRRAQRLAEQTTIPSSAPATAESKIPDSPELPTSPECFTRQQKELFRNLVVDLLAAKVPLKRVDSHAISQAVRCISAIEDAETIGNAEDANYDQRLAALRLKYQYGQSLKDWLDRICATVPTRARIGLKPEPEKKKMGTLAQLIAAKRGHGD